MIPIVGDRGQAWAEGEPFLEISKRLSTIQKIPKYLVLSQNFEYGGLGVESKNRPLYRVFKTPFTGQT